MSHSPIHTQIQTSTFSPMFLSNIYALFRKFCPHKVGFSLLGLLRLHVEKEVEKELKDLQVSPVIKRYGMSHTSNPRHNDCLLN